MKDWANLEKARMLVTLDRRNLCSQLIRFRCIMDEGLLRSEDSDTGFSLKGDWQAPYSPSVRGQS